MTKNNKMLIDRVLDAMESIKAIAEKEYYTYEEQKKLGDELKILMDEVTEEIHNAHKYFTFTIVYALTISNFISSLDLPDKRKKEIKENYVKMLVMNQALAQKCLDNAIPAGKSAEEYYTEKINNIFDFKK